ncbi:hypothetical protein D3C72_1388950 [compost metagenome]
MFGFKRGREADAVLQERPFGVLPHAAGLHHRHVLGRGGVGPAQRATGLGQRVRLGDQQQKAVGHQRHIVQVGVLGVGGGQGEVDLARAHQIEGRARQRVAHFQGDVRVRLAIGHQHARQQARGKRRQRGNRHLPLLGAGDAADRRDGVAKRRLQGGGLLHEDLARRRQPHGARGAVEQAHGQGLFDTLYLGG